MVLSERKFKHGHTLGVAPAIGELKRCGLDSRIESTVSKGQACLIQKISSKYLLFSRDNRTVIPKYSKTG